MCENCNQPENPNKENLRKWVEALRSGKYVQGTGTNYNAKSDTYCCLGVACHVAEENGVDPTGPGGIHWRSRGALTGQVAEWLGVGRTDPILVGAYNPEEVFDDSRTASRVNDTDGMSFAEIADLIEKRYNLKDDDALENAAS